MCAPGVRLAFVYESWYCEVVAPLAQLSVVSWTARLFGKVGYKLIRWIGSVGEHSCVLPAYV